MPANKFYCGFWVFVFSICVSSNLVNADTFIDCDIADKHRYYGDPSMLDFKSKHPLITMCILKDYNPKDVLDVIGKESDLETEIEDCKKEGIDFATPDSIFEDAVHEYCDRTGYICQISKQKLIATCAKDTI